MEMGYIRKTWTGTGDMAIQYQPEQGGYWRPVCIRAHFRDESATAAVQDADVTVQILTNILAPQDDQSHNVILAILPGCGLTRDLIYQPHPDYRPLIPDGSGISIAWTNPDDGLISWGLELVYAHDD